MEKIKSKFNVENLLCLFVIMCPVLDMVSFLFRNVFKTNFSPSTFVRPVIPAVIMLYLFIKKDKNFKIKSIIVALVYLIYAVIHIFLFSKLKTLSSYSNEMHEIQYLVNYTFMILNLFLYIYIFKDKNADKLRKSVLIASMIYIASIFISIITKTSSYTYLEEQMGFKGWFESGNSICAILLVAMFAYLPLLKNKKYRIITAVIAILIGAFLTLLVGTRVGLFGFVIVLAIYIATEVFQSLIKNHKLNKKVLGIGSIAILTIISVVAIFGSNTLQRRKDLKNKEQNIVDNVKNEQSHITGDLLEIKQKIENGTLEEGYMTEAQKQSIMDLYNIANEWNVKNNDQRMQQLIYNVALVKNQARPELVLFGNGYILNFRELIFEMEVPAILINFGLIGFLLYLVPFIVVLVYGLFKGIKVFKGYDSEYARLFLGCGFAFALSFFAGYTFFNQSSAMMIIVLNCLLINRITTCKNENIEISKEK